MDIWQYLPNVTKCRSVMGSTHIAPPHAVGQQSCGALHNTVGPQAASQMSTDNVGGHEPPHDTSDTDVAVEKKTSKTIECNTYSNCTIIAQSH